MIASEICDIINEFAKKENPYHCILIDGAWGIGKSFQVDKALEGNSCAICISLFGITTFDEILTQLAVKICSGTGKKIKFTSLISKLSTILGEIDIGPISSIGKLLGVAISPQILLNTILDRSNKDQPLLIVLDDVERINVNLDMDLFLGSIETVLLKKENIKVLFMANLEQMPKEAKSIWDRCAEKLIDRSYFVDELANEIEFFSNPDENKSALVFLQQHGCKNLRTLQKAEKFFLDVKSRIQPYMSMLLQNEASISSLRIACYATVVECIEKIYEQEYQRQKKEQPGKRDLMHNIFVSLKNGPVEGYVCYKYLVADDLAKVFAPYLITYFEKGEFDLDGMLSAYNKYINGEKSIYYMSDDEVREQIEKIKSYLIERRYNNLFGLLQKADEVYIWSDIMHLEVDDIERMVSEELPKEYEKLLAQKGKLDFTLSSICAGNIQSARMKNFLIDFIEKETEIYVGWLIKQFKNSLENGDYAKIYQQLDYIAKLFRELQSRERESVIVQFSSILCKEWLLPIGSISEIQYFCCQKSYELAMTYFPERYNAFLQEYKTIHTENYMFLNRMKNIKQNYDEHFFD